MVKAKEVFEVIHPYSAGIDISSTEHFVCVPDYCSSEPIRRFGSLTEDLHSLVSWLKESKITTVAMESTGIYWLQLYLLLEENGIEPYLVNAKHAKNVTGRKSDVIDCQWLQQLHSVGLLAKSYQPEDEIRVLRNLMRSRGKLIKQRGATIVEQQRALDYMNIKLHNVISDLDGLTGQNIVLAIINGERDPERLVLLANSRIKADRSTLVKSLQGVWKEDQIFLLRQAYNAYNFYNNQIHELDREFENQILLINQQLTRNNQNKSRKKGKQSGMSFKAGEYLNTLYGVDITRIEGINEQSAMELYSELGVNIKEKFPTIKRFIAWLNLAPNTKISGGKVLSSKMQKKKNKVGQIFRKSAFGVLNSKGNLGEYIRVKKARSGVGTAMVATAQKIARYFYKVVTEKVEFDPEVLTNLNQLNLKRKIDRTEKYLNKLKLYQTEYQLDII